ncbi:MAG: outer membrane protein assembly factor BamC [Gammaproteobacteria bacterium]|nr:outer membrane protein assembly factor BamC [Gammaproteobacteria bacterium]MYE31016.1 outer membrane protein assembly factor BamC [Gammaproteobacteria bacterium]MYI01628.1 outer membrane protein assembly factor BamC [Gammaproteobacteria bacterium]
MPASNLRTRARQGNCMSRARAILLLAALAAFSGCSFFGGGEEEDEGGGLLGIGGEDGVFGIGGDPETYRDARILPPMEIPPELDSYTIDALYVIPENPVISGLAFEDDIPLPKPIETRRREGVVIQNLGDRRWIVIDATPAQVWPLVRDFWSELDLELDLADPGLGTMETAWLEAGNAPETRQKYRIVIEPGLHSASSEITVRHLQNLRTQPVPLTVEWPEVSDDFDMERQILGAISQYLADRNDIYQASTASLLAGTIEGARKANIVENLGGNPYLQLRIDYDRAWVQVRQALDNADIEIVDSNRDESVFNVRFAGIVREQPEPGFVRRLFGGSNEAPELVFRDFTVRLERNGDSIDVTSELPEEPDEAARLNRELLQVIIENLV